MNCKFGSEWKNFVFFAFSQCETDLRTTSNPMEPSFSPCVCVGFEVVGEGKKRYTVAHFVPKWHNDTTAQTTTRRQPASVCKQTNKMQKPAGAAWLYIYFGSIWISNALKVYAAPLENRCGIFLHSVRWDDFLQICVCADFCARGREILAEFREFYAAHTFFQEVLILMPF